MANSDKSESNKENDNNSRALESKLDKTSHDHQAGASDIKSIENTRTNAHSGSAGGEDESIQIESIDSAGNKLIASRISGVTESKLLSATESLTQSHMDLKVAAKSNSILEPVVNLRDYAEKLPAADPSKQILRDLAKEQFQSFSAPSAYHHTPCDDDAGSFQIIKKEDGGIQLNTGVEYAQDDTRERIIGGTIGIVESIAALSIDLAKVADFTSAVLKGDKKTAEEMGTAFGELLGKSILSGINIFEQSYNYLYEIGFQNDAAKPFKDIVTLGFVLDRKWSQLPPKEQERLKFRLITDLASGLLPIGATSKMKQADNLSNVLMEAGTLAKEINASEKTVITAVGGLSDELSTLAMKELQPGERFVGGPIGSWKVYDCIESERVIRQSEPLSCASACGEMLVDGLRNEEWFKNRIGVPATPKDLAATLKELTGQNWRGGSIIGMPLDRIMEQTPWSAIFCPPHDLNLHMVVVDGWVNNGSILIRDPANGMLYKMTESDFKHAWRLELSVVRIPLK